MKIEASHLRIWKYLDLPHQHCLISYTEIGESILKVCLEGNLRAKPIHPVELIS